MGTENGGREFSAPVHFKGVLTYLLELEAEKGGRKPETGNKIQYDMQLM